MGGDAVVDLNGDLGGGTGVVGESGIPCRASVL